MSPSSNVASVQFASLPGASSEFSTSSGTSSSPSSPGASGTLPCTDWAELQPVSLDESDCLPGADLGCWEAFPFAWTLWLLKWIPVPWCVNMFTSSLPETLLTPHFFKESCSFLKLSGLLSYEPSSFCKQFFPKWCTLVPAIWRAFPNSWAFLSSCLSGSGDWGLCSGSLRADQLR